MKATEHFKQTIKTYLDERAKNDELFAVSYAKENKNMDDCATFILNQVKRSKCMGLTDEEVYSLAVHFFDEDDIEIGNSIACNVIVNHVLCQDWHNTCYYKIKIIVSLPMRYL